jgi:hypothetical protein
MICVPLLNLILDIHMLVTMLKYMKYVYVQNNNIINKIAFYELVRVELKYLYGFDILVYS